MPQPAHSFRSLGGGVPVHYDACLCCLGVVPFGRKCLLNLKSHLSGTGLTVAFPVIGFALTTTA